jgi:hypothetical protein
MVYETTLESSGIQELRPMNMPGDGTVSRAVAAMTENGDAFVTSPCPACGESETPGWLPGFVPPV